MSNLEAQQLFPYSAQDVHLPITEPHFQVRGSLYSEKSRAKDCGKEARHAVLVVGFTPSYWIIKNSLGLQWGDSGFALLERGTNACGIDNTYASVATKVSLF